MEKDTQNNSKQKSRSENNGYIRLFVTGFTMGLADLIPGVSGGTVAFISGIYEELLYSIKILSGDVLKSLIRLQFKEAISAIPFKFLLPLGLGLVIAIVTLANIFSYLLENYPAYVWGFFFGLVMASTYIVLKRVVKWDLTDKIAFGVAAIAAYFIVGAVPVATPENLLMFFLAGMIAIVAMILPGISGSFILVILGKYEQVLHAVTERNVLALISLLLGAAIGISIFARVLTWLFARYHDISIAILAGFMLGSLRKLWPWKEVISTRIDSEGVVVPVVEKNILPANFDLSVLIIIVLAALAMIIVIYLEKMHAVREVTSDIDDPEFRKQHRKSIKREE